MSWSRQPRFFSFRLSYEFGEPDYFSIAKTS
jgi:hypothetical protein